MINFITRILYYMNENAIYLLNTEGEGEMTLESHIFLLPVTFA